jgi:hypothetical protein
MTAIPAVGWIFSSWGGDLTGTKNPTTLVVNGNKAVTATFVAQQYTLTVNKAGTGSGTVTLNPAAGSYVYGTSVTLTATPAAGSTFAGWSGGLTGSANPTTMIITSANTVTATFTRITYTLTIQSPDGSGSTSLTVGGHTYNWGDTVQITATPSSGLVLDHWVLDGSNVGSSNPLTLTMGSDHTLKAVFTQGLSLGIFSDSACTTPLTSISWGALDQGATITKILYVKNLGTVSGTLHMTLSNWSPSDAPNHITITWNRENTILAPNISTQATLTLTVKDDIHDITTFNVDIDITANQV